MPYELTRTFLEGQLLAHGHALERFMGLLCRTAAHALPSDRLQCSEEVICRCRKAWRGQISEEEQDGRAEAR